MTSQQEFTIDKILLSIRELKESQDRLKESQQKTDEQMKKTDEQMKKTDEKLERMGIHLGGISNNNGEMAEEFFYGSLKEKLKIAGIQYDYIGRNWENQGKGKKEEYDIILTNGKYLEIVEVKYKVHPADLEKLERKYTNFKDLFPTYKDFEIRASIAGMTMSQDIINQAKEKGFHALLAKGDHIEEVA